MFEKLKAKFKKMSSYDVAFKGHGNRDVNKEDIDYTDWKYLVKRMMRENIKPYFGWFIFAIVLMLIIAGLTGVRAWLVQPALDKVFLEKDASMLILIPLGVLVIAFVIAVITYIEGYIMSILNMRISFNLQERLYSHFMYSDMKVLGKKSSGQLLSNLGADVGGVIGATTLVLQTLIKQLFTVISLVSVMFIQSVELSLIALVGFPLAIYPIRIMAKKLRKFSGQELKKLEQFTSHLSESLEYTRLVKAYNAEDYEIKRLRGHILYLFKLGKKKLRVSLISSPMMEMLGTAGVAGVIWYGGMQVINGTTTQGAFFAFFVALLSAYKPIKSLSKINLTIQKGLKSAERLYMMFDEMPDIYDNPKAKELSLKDVEGHIELKDVAFNYTPEKVALKGMNLDIPAGETVALVGASGGGKSTVMNMVLRFYDPEKGSVLLDGQDLKDIRVSSLRNSIALVSQDVQLFDDTVFENIRYANINATMDDVVKAAKMAEAHDFITEMPDGYMTKVGQDGSRLSGGQKQRISIARAILCDAPILLLDEATSALDPISEKLVQKALDKMMEGRTTLVIAHRLSTVVGADKICVIDRGRVAEEGSHAELLSMDGIYANLYSKQFEIENSKK